MRTRTWSTAGLLVAASLLAGCAAPTVSSGVTTTRAPVSSLEGRVVTVHKTPTCGCCGEYEEHLAAHGLTVVVEEHDALTEVKAAFGVPDELASCHTNELEGYAVEGHVPLEALADLLDQAPDVDGIALAGMPSGAPGMPGEQTEPFEVRTFDGDADTGPFGDY